MSSVRVGRSIALIAALALVSSTALAQVMVPMSGKWGNRRGPFVAFPVIGPTTCGPAVIGRNFNVPGGTATPPIPSVDPLGVPNPQPINPGGCIAGAGTGSVNTTMSPASFVFPANFFSLPAPSMTNRVTVPLPNILSVATLQSFMGPSAAPMSPISPTMGVPNPTSPTNLASWRHFRASAWTSQTGRAGANFTWCWGNPACANIAGGTAPLIIKYTAGTNRFGGTMSLILGGFGGHVAIVNQPPLPAGALAINNLSFLGSFGTGRGYAAFMTASIMPGPIYAAYMVSSGGLLSAVTPPTPVLNIPTGTNYSFGFPWTTGAVVARNTGTAAGNPVVQTLTAHGSDNRTPAGKSGNITLVAGSVSRTLLAGVYNPSPTVQAMNLTFLPEPGAALQLASGALGLFGLVAWRRRRRG